MQLQVNSWTRRDSAELERVLNKIYDHIQPQIIFLKVLPIGTTRSV